MPGRGEHEFPSRCCLVPSSATWARGGGPQVDPCTGTGGGLCDPSHGACAKPCPGFCARGTRRPLHNRQLRGCLGAAAPRTRDHRAQPLGPRRRSVFGCSRRALGCFRLRAVALGSFRPRSAPAAPPRPVPRGSDWLSAEVGPAFPGVTGRGFRRCVGRAASPLAGGAPPSSPRVSVLPSHWPDALGPAPASHLKGRRRRRAD